VLRRLFQVLIPIMTHGLALAMGMGAEEPKNHWAFRPLVPEKAFRTRDSSWVRDGLDAYILAGLEAAGLGPAAEADRITWLRRVTVDLTGLPPSPEEVDGFLADPSPEAWERVVDRLLSSPRYGERWGRHWLDLARYADTGGYHNDLDRPHAWKYRDYVIRSFNEDKPYARFVAEQLAGDEVDGADLDSLIATGFCRNGPSNDDNMGKSDAAIAQYRADQLDDVISTAASVFLGVTLGCARCHDHKTEPFSQADYYRFLALFNGTEKLGLVPGTQDRNDRAVAVDPSVEVHALIEKRPEVPPTRIMIRGDATSLGDEVTPGVPHWLAPHSLPHFRTAAGAQSSGRRRALAEWITAPENALAWRVLANRVWRHHFGSGLVEPPGDFGVTAPAPSHPELLDYLAARILTHGGRLKPLHREIVLSATYRQSGTGAHPAGQVTDPDNRLLGRMPLRRIEAEVLRDSILQASGNLNSAVGGPGIKPRLRPDLLPASQRNKWPAVKVEGPEHWRRSVYVYAKRQLLLPMLELFDAPTTTDSCSARTESTVPTQALVLWNDEFVEIHAGFLARRALAETGGDRGRALERVFRHTLVREPDAGRAAEALAFVREREAALGGDLAGALADLAHVLFNSSEFLHVE